MRRFLNSEVGPVPITAEMSPEQQEIFRAANAGVREALSKGKQTKRSPKQFKWAVQDRFRLGRMASLPKGMYEALRDARKINPAVNESTLRSFAKQYRSELAKNP